MVTEQANRMPVLYLSHGAPHWRTIRSGRGNWPTGRHNCRNPHFAPMFVALGAGESDMASQRTVIDEFWHGLAKRSIQLG